MKNLNFTEVEAMLKDQQLVDWKIENQSIKKEFVFKNFVIAMEFMNAVGVEAEKMNHHPNWSNVYNKVNVELSTHDTGGITSKDIELANVFEKFYIQYK